MKQFIDFDVSVLNNQTMETASSSTEPLNSISAGVKNVEDMRRAAERLDKAREETKARVGIVNVAVEFVREARECDYSSIVVSQ